LREQLKNLSPEEREAKIREFRERRGVGPNREEMEKLREELKNLPPQERAAKIREWREKQMNDRPGLKLMTAEDRQAKRKEIRARLDKQLADLRKMKAEGTLTAEERNRLDRMEEVAKRFEQSADAGPGLRPLPPKAPGEELAKPPPDRNRNP
jgi:hypothetical protein